MQARLLRLISVLILAIISMAISTAAHAALQDENILTPLPKGFKVGWQSENGGIDQSEYIPKSETVDDWSTMITVQIFHDAKSITPDAFADNLKQRIFAACPGAEAEKSFEGIENGYPYSMWIMSCPTNPKTTTPEFFFMKVIGGNDALYDVQYAFRKDLGMDLMNEAMAYLKRVGVCDTRLSDRPCPAGM